MAAGRIHLKCDPSIGEAYVDVLARHRLDELTVLGESNPKSEGTGMAPAGAHSAPFAEIRVDKDLGLVRVARLASVVDAGRVLNAKTARSQILGGAIMGIGMALLEETSFDRTGRIANATLADYLIPANADVPGDRGRLRRRAGPVQPDPEQGPRRDRPHGRGGRHRERRLPRDPKTHPVAAHHARQALVARARLAPR
jgi:xanthine dehydrogenase YagR molybdenum-binding subunit